MDGESTYTTNENWFQREGGAIKSMCCGFLVVILCSMMIFWNETNLVIAQATADVMKGAEVVQNCAPSSEQGALVFAACDVNAPDISDHVNSQLHPFVGKFEGSSISWSTEIYQWVEQRHDDQHCTKTKTGGKSCTHNVYYTYNREWSSSAVNSGNFRSQYGHDNQGSIPFSDGSYTLPAYGIYLSNKPGSAASVSQTDPHFVLDGNLQSQFPSKSVPLKSEASANGMQVSGGYVRKGNGDEIGDTRTSVSGSGSAKASVCALQGSDLDGGVKLGPSPPQPFDIWGRMTYPLEDLRGGIYTKKSFIAMIKSENQVIADLLRVVGFIVMIWAFFCIYKPLSVMADLLMFLDYCTCCLGSILDKASQAIIGCVACASGCFCFTFIFTCAWMVANPTYAVCGVIVLCCICGLGAGARFGGLIPKKDAQARECIVDTPYLKMPKGGLTVVAVV